MKSYISMIPYANLAPVRRLGCPDGFAFIYLSPRQSVDALISGCAVAAPVPVGALLELAEQVEPLGQYGIAASEEVGSVFLYSRKPFAELGAADRLFLTGQSATSVLLLYLLLTGRPAPAALPQAADRMSDAEAALLIGDDALVNGSHQPYPLCFDLARLWHEQVGRPIVFARWVVRRDASPAVKAQLLAWLRLLDTRDAELIAQAAPLEARRLGMSPVAMVTYLQGMRRVLSPEDLESQAFFLERARQAMPAYRDWRRGVRSGSAVSAISVSPDGTGRLDRTAALRLLQDAPLGELMARAHAERLRRHPGGLVTFVMDTNPNYTNVCTTRCRFCAFHRDAAAADAYTLSPAALAERVKAAAAKGATTVLLQGGINSRCSLAQLVGYIRAIQAACPRLHIHPFSPPEIDAVARLENRPVTEILKTLWDEGIHTLPGGGAEILVDRVRQAVSPDKCSADRWLEVMETAHRLGFRTTATMMYGHVETAAEIIEHLFRLREVQDRTGGFTSFIAWSFKPGNSPLSDAVAKAAHPALYVRIVALARLVLDNFEHVQSSWFSESENAGSLGLLAGADDFGGILVEENVLRTTGHVRQTSTERVKTLIRGSGFIPAQRDSDYRLLEVCEQ